MTEMRHGTWWDLHKDRTPAQIMEGRFTRLFGALPAAAFDPDDLLKLATAMSADPEPTPTPETDDDGEENSGITSAYTYFGQFIDHDLTLDPTSHLRQRVSAEQLRDLVDFRTPRFDLDNVYGRGQTEQPYLYDGKRMVLGARLTGNPHDAHARDLPRGPNGRALIGDPRNDENRIVSQLQATMLRFHNRMADAMPNADFEAIRDAVRWHYQWVVIHDFLPTIIHHETIEKVFPHTACDGAIGEHPPVFSIPKLRGGLELMPVEFSVAAYRFGHSMIRPIYRLNETISRRAIFSKATDPAGDLGGFRPMPSDWAIDWQFFIDIEGGTPAVPDPNPNDEIKRKPQPAYKIDGSLVSPLAFLPPSVAKDPASLGLRNLLRGNDFGLPSGQEVAKALGITPIGDDKLVIGKATNSEEDVKTPLAEIADGAFACRAPLWAYVLAEAHVTSLARPHTQIADPDRIPIRLGPVGGTIIAEVFAALLVGDAGSYLNANPGFKPHAAFTRNGAFGLAELIRAALGR